MRRENLFVTRAKRAVCSGLFLGVMCGLTGCVNPVVNPEITGTPASTPTGIVLPTSVPEPSTVPPELTATVTPEPSIAPKPTPEPSTAPTMTPVPTEEPVTSTPEPLMTATPEPDVTPTLVPEQTATPEPEATMTPVPMPTDCPDYVTLLQNGWQRTEDFFGRREIFFSGKFDRTELIVSEGRYEYRYTASSDEEVWFYIIGEEGLPVQLYLDELTQTETECRISQEGGEDYSYSYEDGEIRVNGRIYACKTEEAEHRMRIEIRYRYEEEKPTEGYEFYLK